MADEPVAAGAPMAEPVAPRERHGSLDLLRGFAVLGILAMNVATFAMPMAAYMNPAVYLENEGANAWTYRVVHVLFDLKMMSLFSMLFGAGVIMWAMKPGPVKRLRSLWFRRMFWLLVIGLVHAYLIWDGDILVTYALVGIIALWWLRRLPWGWMLAIAAVFLAINIVAMSGTGAWVFANEHPDLAVEKLHLSEEAVRKMTAPEAGYENIRSWFNPTQAQLDREVAIKRGSWLDVFYARAPQSAMMQTQMFFMYMFWRAAAMMLIGAALAKLGVLTGRRSTRFYALLAAAGYAAGLPLVIGGIVYNESHNWDPGWMNLVGVYFNYFGSIGVALGHVGLLVWLQKRGVLGALGRALSAAGRMAFTNYLMQSIICSLIFYGWALGWHGYLTRPEQQLVVVAIWIVELSWSVWWLKRFRFGPAEWLWRSLTYWRRQPMRRRVEAEARSDRPANDP